jgi:SAM-dependent methyltransferase
LPQPARDLVVPDKWFDEVAESERKLCLELSRVDSRVAVTNLIGARTSAYKLVRPYLKSPRDKVLAMGSGYGDRLAYLLKRDVDTVGIEPGNTVGFEDRYTRARELLAATDLPQHRLLPGVGELLPFGDGVLDLVFSTAVLEHVDDVESCMREAIRVTKPGGRIVKVVISYDSFYEGQYPMLWLPYLLRIKRAARWWVRRVHGRTDYFIDELTFTIPQYFRELLARIAPSMRGSIHLYLRSPLGLLTGVHARLARLAGVEPDDDSPLLWPTRAAQRVLEMLGFALSFRVQCWK